MSDSTPPVRDSDAIFARVAAATRTMNEGAHAGAEAVALRRMLEDLEAASAHLRQGTTEIAAALAQSLESISRPDMDGQGDDRSGALADLEIDPLTRLAIVRGTDKWGPHFYTPIYHELFAHLRALPIRLLEIGVGGHDSAVMGGSSLLMWADYFPHAHIVGIDIAEKRLPPHPRITIARGSQDDQSFLSDLLAAHGPFDIVIDDGSHQPAHVRASFDLLFPALTKDGFYVIEDVQTAFWPEFGGSSDGAETMTLARTALQALNHAEIRAVESGWPAPPMSATIRSVRAYHNLLVFQKGDNTEPSKRRYDRRSPHVARAIAAMERQLARTPTPEGFAMLARTYRLARSDDKALDVAQTALEQWPDHVPLLVVGVKAARRAGDQARTRQYLQRLEAVAGSDPVVRELIRKVASE